ncbi:hypothetical protein KY290_017521 [Solanum tuberosum]|uniref:Integrase core domain containing protein n=1 Tax=Solanum tuberosum TaxID=4113 RepID=A0ABQ7VBG9_SOLTU|nr:hypothetical protein KY290_017521 [Solanum tuberosum]
MTQFRKEWSHRVQEAEEDLDKATDGTRPSDKDLDDDTIDDALLFYRSTQAPQIEVSCSEQPGLVGPNQQIVSVPDSHTIKVVDVDASLSEKRHMQTESAT